MSVLRQCCHGHTTLAVAVATPSLVRTSTTCVNDKYLQTKTVLSSPPFAPDLPTTDNYVDLDPHYTDIYGDPLARLTYDWTPNMYIGATYLANKVKDIFTKMGASSVTVSNAVLPGAVHNDWWGHHLRGGCRIGTDPT